MICGYMTFDPQTEREYICGLELQGPQFYAPDCCWICEKHGCRVKANDTKHKCKAVKK